MTQSQSISNRLKEVYLDGTWVANTNYNDLLEDITWEESEKKISDLNTLAALTFHINYYLEGLINVLKGGSLDISDANSFKCSEIKSERDWSLRKEMLIDNAKTFIRLVNLLPDKALQDDFIKEEYGTLLRNIEGVLEHSYYHLGQMSLIKKMIRT